MSSLLEDVSELEPKTIDALLKATKAFETIDAGAVYSRGQADASWGLEPSIGRVDDYAFAGKRINRFSPEQEQKLLHRFRRYAFGHVGRHLGIWEALFLARHHGLPVRLLDWTSNPLVALFNAVADERHAHECGAVWLLRRKARYDTDVDVLKERTDPLQISGVRMIYPTYVSERLVAQSGCFTLHGEPWPDLACLDSSSIDPADCDVDGLAKLEIPADCKTDLAKDLMRVAINSRTLFPDLDGLAKGLLELEVIRKHG